MNGEDNQKNLTAHPSNQAELPSSQRQAELQMNGEDNQKDLTFHPSNQVELPPAEYQVKKQSPRWRSLIPILIGLLLLGGLGWLLFSRVILPMMMGGKQMAPPPTPVPLANPKSAPIQDSVDYPATLDSRQSVTLQPRVAGQISAIYVQPGDRVKAGQPILQIDAAQQRAQVSSRTAAAQTAAANVQTAQAEVANAADTLKSLQAQRAAAAANVQLNQQEFQRYQGLTQQGATSQQILDQRANALKTAQADLRQAEADIQAQRSEIGRTQSAVISSRQAVKEAEANIAEGQAALEQYTITAPFSGTVSTIPAKVGDAVTAATQLLNITQNKQLEVQIQIPFEQASSARLGLPVKLLDDQKREVRTGRISFIAPNVEAGDQSVRVEAIFENGGEALRSSQAVSARVIWSSRPGILVPTTAISRLGGRDFLFVAAPFKDSGCKAPAAGEGGKSAPVDPDQLVAAQKPIKLGKIVNNDQQVLEGVTASDRIVVSGILQLQNCAPIADAASSAPPPSP